MSDSVVHGPSATARAGHGKGKNATKRGYVYGLLLVAFLASLVIGVFFSGAKDHLKQYANDLTLRDVFVWLNPAFSEVPEELLPFGAKSAPPQSDVPPAQLSKTEPETSPFMDKENPFYGTAGHAAGPPKDAGATLVPFVREPLSGLTPPDNSSLILPETPRGVETTIKPPSQLAKDLNSGTQQPQGGDVPSDKKDSGQPSAPESSSPKKPGGSEPTEASTPQKQISPSPRKDTPDWEATPRSEKFQLPGSVLVKIQNYAGAAVRWDLAVILDDSHSMGRQTKSWNPSRFQTALTFIQKLPSALNSGSRMAVRDFLCSGGKENKEPSKGCSSRLLIDWTPASSKQWKDLLEKADHGGATDPCAAVALSVKRDFHGGAGRKPRLLVITGGAAAPCASSRALKAIESSETTKGLPVDVVALGLGKKRQKGFSALAQRTGGVFIELERPADVDHAFHRYAKILQAKVFEKVEIKNERISLSFNPHQEMSLAPGKYTVALPLVEGLDPSKRVIHNVTVSSAETTIIDVTIRKGRPIVRIEKRQ
ncbi:MAG: hypothetical protein ACP5M0_10030 [Desulfomonilaceae bacterium]